MNSVVGRSERNRKPSETLRSWDIRKKFGSKVHIEFGNSRNQNSFRTLSLPFRMFSENFPYLSETFPFFPLGLARSGGDCRTTEIVSPKIGLWGILDYLLPASSDTLLEYTIFYLLFLTRKFLRHEVQRHEDSVNGFHLRV